MNRCHEYRSLPYSPQQMFDLVIDIESYPGFVPGFQSAQVTARNGNTLHASQSLGLGAVHLEFDSTATLDHPQAIHIVTTASAPLTLEIAWRFADTRPGCRLDFRASCHSRNPILDKLLKHWLQWNSSDIVNAFQREAQRRYSRPSQNNHRA